MVKIKIQTDSPDVWLRRCIAVTKLVAAITTLVITIVYAIKNQEMKQMGEQKKEKKVEEKSLIQQAKEQTDRVEK